MGRGGFYAGFVPDDPKFSQSILKHTLSNSAPPFHATETSLREFWRFPRQVRKLYAMNPCQSTGTWYLQPTAAARAFMRAMARRVLHEPHHWDQTAWNEVILPFIWGNGEDAPQLRYRLLPHRSYANANVVDRRREEGLPLDLVVLHSGYLHGQEKVKGEGGRGFCSFLWFGWPKTEQLVLKRAGRCLGGKGN